MKPTRTAAPGDAIQRCRVLHVVGSMGVGGTELYVLNVLRHFDRKAFDMDACYTGPHAGALAAEVARQGSQLIACRYGHTLLPFVWRLARILRAGRYDVVCAYAGDFAAGPLLAARMAGVGRRIALYRSSSYKFRPTLGRRLVVRALHRMVVRDATVLLGNSRANLEAAFKPGEWDERFAVVYNGVDLNRFVPANDHARRAARRALGFEADDPVIGHVGSFVPVKAHDVLLRAFAGIARARANARLLLVGDGPLRPWVADQAVRLGIADRVTFTGVRHDVPRLLEAMDVFVMPSRFEGFPNAIIEAQAAGLPVVASDRPEFREAIPPENHDLLAPVADAAGFSRQIARLLQDAGAARQRGAAGLAFVHAHLSMSESVERFCRYMLPPNLERANAARPGADDVPAGECRDGSVQACS